MKIFKHVNGQIFKESGKNYLLLNGWKEEDFSLMPDDESNKITTPQKDLVMLAKAALSSELSADIKSGGHSWQVRNSIDLQNIKDAIDEHNYAGLEGNITQSFRMADNTWQDLTVDKFEKVLSDYRLRKKELYSKYKAWTSGDMLEEFEI